MKTDQRFILAMSFLMASCTLFSGCNSPEHHRGSGDIVTKDTTQGANLSTEPVSKLVTEPTKIKPLTLIIKNLASPKAPVNVVFYDAKHKFLSKTDRLKGYKFSPNGNILTVQIDDLNYGEYAIATYQDVNCDGSCDKSLIGIPKEPYGFSNNFKPSLKAPCYGDCKFDYNINENIITIAMLRK